MGAGYSGGIYISDSSQIADDVIIASDLGVPTTKGGLIAYDTAPVELVVGANDLVLTADSTETTGLKWATASAVAGGSPIFVQTIAEAITSVQGTWAGSQQDTSYYWAYGLNNGASRNLNDEYTIPVYLMQGTYSLYFYMRRGSASGIITISISGSSIGTLDGYNGGVDYIVQSITGINVAVSGLKTISVKLTSKNASATNYDLYHSGFTFVRTA